MRPPVCQRDLKDVDLARHGCVIASLAWIRREAGGEAVTESRMRALRKASGADITEFRRRGVMLGEAQAAQATAYPSALRLPPTSRRVLDDEATVRRDIIPDLEDGAWALVWTNYAIVQDGGRGITSFRGSHGVVYCEPTSTRMTVIDPLRREVVTWPLDLAIRAAERFGSKKRINALVIRRSPTWREERDRYQQLMRKARGQRDELKARVAALEAQVDGTALERLRSVAKTVAGRLEEQAELLDAAVAG